MRRFLILTFFLSFSISGLFAQVDSLFPLKGKTVAVYFSKKQFSFDDHYRIALSQFIMADEGRDVEIDDVKTQSLVALGTLFSGQLKDATQADSVYFLNEYPNLARKFIQHYSADTHKLKPMGPVFGQTDYILVVNPFILSSYKTSAVYTRSNRIITEQVTVKSGRIRFELYDPKNGLMRHIFEACVDDRKTSVPKALFEFHMKASKTGRFLGKLFTLATEHMNMGKKGNCNE